MRFTCSMGVSAMADQIVWPPFLSRDRKWPHIKCTHLRGLGGGVDPRLESNLMFIFCCFGGIFLYFLCVKYLCIFDNKHTNTFHHFLVHQIIRILQDLQVMKVNRPGLGVSCYVAKLNRSDTSLPRALLNDNIHQVWCSRHIHTWQWHTYEIVLMAQHIIGRYCAK